MTWQYSQLVNPAGFGIFSIYMWSGEAITWDQQYHLPILTVSLTDNVATIVFDGTHSFSNGTAITISDVGAPFDGSGWNITAHTSFSVSYACTSDDIASHSSDGTLGYGAFHEDSSIKNDYTDVTFFRDVPTIVSEMTFADPFSDATAVLEFPQCTGFDGPSQDTWWLRENVNVDINWVPATTVASDYPVINPQTNSPGMFLHPENSVPVWEGFTVSVDPSPTSVSITCQGALYQLDKYRAKPLNPLVPKAVEDMISRYFDPLRRGIYTKALKIDWAGNTRAYSSTDYNKFRALGTRFIPSGMTIGQQWTGYLTRNTGAWDQALTGYIQGQLSFLYVPPEQTLTNYRKRVLSAKVEGYVVELTLKTGHGAVVGDVINVSGMGHPYDGIHTVGSITGTTVTWNDPTSYDESTLAKGWMAYTHDDNPDTTLIAGDQWTILKDPDRQPVMKIRTQSKPPDYAVWYGQPGVEARLSRDSAQTSNVVFGRGTGYDKTAWMVQNFPENAQWSTWAPIAYDSPDDVPIYHWDEWDEARREDLYDGYDAENERRTGVWVTERFWNSIPSGIEFDDGQKIATQYIERDKDPGWSGEIIVKVDPLDLDGDPVSKWLIKPGDVIWLKGFYGTDGITPVLGTNKFHISQVRMTPKEGTVALTVDTKFRDLLTVEESLINARDPLAPVKMMELGKSSTMIEDLAAPWNQHQGAGFVPTRSVNLKRPSAAPHTAETHDNSANRPANLLKSTSPAHPSNNTDLTISNYGNWQVIDNSTLYGHYDDPEEAFYIPINLGNANKSYRWGFVPLILSQAGTIEASTFALYDVNGNVLQAQYCISVWAASLGVTQQMMPQQLINGHAENAALWKGAFSERNPDTGTAWPDTTARLWAVGNTSVPMIIGWGTYEKPCGYYPGSLADHNPPTGEFRDGAPWEYNFVGSTEFGESGTAQSNVTQRVPASAYSATIAIYAENTSLTTGTKWCFAMGKFRRQVPTGNA